MKYEHLVYRMPIPSLAVVSDVKEAPATGKIKSALIHFPARCNALVEIEVYKRKKKILPSTRDGIALDDVTERFNIDEDVEIGDPIEVIGKNHDNTYDHTIIVIIEVEK